MGKVNGKRKFLKKKPYKKKRAVKPSPAFKKMVRKVTHEDLEDKQCALFPDPSNISPIMNAVTDLKIILPQIAQGAADHQRIGDRINGKSLIIRGHLELSTSQQTSDGPTRIIVRLMVLSDKRQSIYDGATATFLNNIIDYGAGTINMDGSVGGANNLRSMYLPLSRDTVTVHYDKLIYMNAPRVFNTGGTQLQNINWENTIKLFKIKVKCKKLLKYTDSSNYPVNFAPYLCACFFQLNGGGNTNAYVRMHYTSNFIYEDP